MTPPQFVMLAGCNGAGKSTSATQILPEGLPFINADEIAKKLATTERSPNIAAGRKLLEEWDRLLARREDFAVETTLAGKSLAARIKALQEAGYRFNLVFLWLPTVNLAIERVAERVRGGGHDIPEEIIKRRYKNGLRNFFDVYQPLADTWSLHSNVDVGYPELVASGGRGMDLEILISNKWSEVNAQQSRG